MQYLGQIQELVGTLTNLKLAFWQTFMPIHGRPFRMPDLDEGQSLIGVDERPGNLVYLCKTLEDMLLLHEEAVERGKRRIEWFTCELGSAEVRVIPPEILTRKIVLNHLPHASVAVQEALMSFSADNPEAALLLVRRCAACQTVEEIVDILGFTPDSSQQDADRILYQLRTRSAEVC